MIEPGDAGRGYRLASESDYFPYGYPGMVCYFELKDGKLAQCSGRGGLRDAVVRAQAGESVLYAVWPGQHRSDLFLIDDVGALAERVAVKRR